MCLQQTEDFCSSAHGVALNEYQDTLRGGCPLLLCCGHPSPVQQGFGGVRCALPCVFFWGGRLRPSGSHCHNGSLEKKKLPGKRHRCACFADVGTNPHVPRQAPPDPHGAPRPPSTTSCCAFWSQPRDREESRGSRAGMETADNETAATLSSPSSSVSMLVSSINVLG